MRIHLARSARQRYAQYPIVTRGPIGFAVRGSGARGCVVGALGF